MLNKRGLGGKGSLAGLLSSKSIVKLSCLI